ncbi:AAA-16 domain-containing protein [Fusarium keratoplasticum]|uniref:AAA-16 domain-containing protein n=1 Tax=Fusarium keratoplasticum TaxID=1328300 RepID=A0ACC0R513_9HYPO|nr:AAA-16 domain-containing protein [Fusarium keratoplasticum]KAI8674657.1 AAA-16 domain-containing protein [Fusarium keratoplasticum]
MAQKGRRNIFFLGRRSDRMSLYDLITEICISIGRDMIQSPSTNLHQWQESSSSQRLRLFAAWLGNESNRDSLLIIDDADAFEPSSLKFILACPAWHIVTSTRDSTLSWTERDFLEVRLQPLTTLATVSILRDAVARLSSGRLELSSQELSSLAQVIHGHPLAAQNVIPFLVTHLNFIPHPVAELMRMFHTGSVEEREVFLKFTAQARSLWDTFEESLQRLELRDGSANAVRLFQLLPYLRTDQQCFHDCWRMNTGRRHQPSSFGPHASVLRSSYLVMSDRLQRLQAVSLITEEREGGSTQSIAFHPLVRHYALVRFHQAELRVAREVILFLHEKAAAHGDGCPGYIKTHLLYYVGVCSELHIGLCDLSLPEAVRLWLRNVIREQSTGKDSHDEMEDAFSEPIIIDQTTLAVQRLLAECKNTHTRLRKEILQADNHEALLMAIRCTTAYREMRESFDSMDRSLDPGLLSQLIEAVELLREVCKAIGHYPDLPGELERFSQQLQAKISSGSSGASDWHS